VERGLDPRDFALVAFGGAGGMHACALAEELGMTRVLMPRAGGVLSALGLAISDLRRDYVRPLLCSLDELDRLDEPFEEMERAAREDLDEPEVRRLADLRYRRQSFELTVDASDPGELAERFGAAHDQRYGYRMDDEPVEVVNARVIATVPVDKPELSEDEPSGDASSETRKVNFDGDWVEAAVHDRAAMGKGSPVEGPAIVEFAEATCAVRPGWSGEIDDVGTLVLERD
jgi:N-methylhydantoinase A